VLNYGDALLAVWQSLTDHAENGALMVLTACRTWRFHDRASTARSPPPARGR
jgi:hypothetical protein